jgi:hypothetical protein
LEGGIMGKHHKSRHKKYRNSYDRYVDRLLKSNNQKLKELGRYPYRKTDGEQAIATALKKMHIRYIPEYVIEDLKGDTFNYRVADFYLPKEKIVIEHLGQWNNPYNKARYNHKKEVYKKNGIKTVYIYPDNLNNLSWILKQRIRQVIYGKSKKGKIPDKFFKANKREKLKLLRSFFYKISFVLFVLSIVFAFVYNPIWFLVIFELILIITFAIVTLVIEIIWTITEASQKFVTDRRAEWNKIRGK